MKPIRSIAGFIIGLLTCNAAYAVPSDLSVLQAIFPHAAISIIKGKHIDWHGEVDGFKFPDVLAAQPVYRVKAPATGGIEQCLASDAINIGHLGKTREVRVKILPYPKRSQDVLAIVQYQFSDANPPGACTALSRMFRLSPGRSGLSVTAAYDFDTTHHNSLQLIQIVELPEKTLLVVIADEGGGGVYGADFTAFDLRSGRFDIVLQTGTIVAGVETDDYTQDFDPAASRASGGRRLCFTKRLYERHDKRLPTPKVTHPCYSIGTKHGDQP